MNNPFEKTYCNPLSLPDYMTIEKKSTAPFSNAYWPVTGKWMEGNNAEFKITRCDYRSEADPDIIFFEGKWYMYGSMDLCYSSDDMLTWEAHHLKVNFPDSERVTKYGVPLNDHEKSLYENVIAPTVAIRHGKIYLMLNDTNVMYMSDSPTGPFTAIGTMTLPDGSDFWCSDPGLFVDDDDRMYLYFGCGVETGIQGVELNGENPTRLMSEPIRIVEFRPESVWECTGARHQDTDCGWIEGADMFKYNGRYYLLYAANGTTYDTYNLGVYYSDEGPLTGFKPQKNAPMCEKVNGICRGSGHGCVVKGPNDSIWVYYTSVVGSVHMFERRIGMDRVTVNGDGELEVITTDEPQWAPGLVDSMNNNSAQIHALTFRNAACATSAREGRDPMYATDENMTTWWMPDDGDNKRQLLIDFRSMYDVYAMRILWKEEGLDAQNGIHPGAIKYIVEITDDLSKNQWETVLDMSGNDKDYLNDYRIINPAKGCAARLTIVDVPKGLNIGVISFTVFGKK